MNQWPAAAGEGPTTDALRRGAYRLTLSIAAANFTNRFSEALGTELEAWRRPTMADTIQRAEYFYRQVPNKAGEGSRFLTALHEAGINLLAFSGFPEGWLSA